MLQEIITYITTPSSSYARKMGYLHEAVAMQAKFQRQHTAWQKHLSHCQQFIRNAAQNCHAYDNATVLGSGLLLDIPIKFLTQAFKQVTLIDTVHLNTVKKTLRHIPNAQLLTSDLNGLNRVFSKPLIQTPPTPITDHFTPTFPHLDLPTDFIISSNLLTQLPVIPRNYVDRYYTVTDNELDAWCKTLITNHLSFLRQMSAQVCLITDTTHTVTHLSSEQVIPVDMLYGVTLPHPEQQWQWQLSPQGEFDQQSELTTNVVAYSDFT